MKIVIKTLQGKQLPVEVEETFTVRQTKVKIEEEHKMAADSQKLIAYGKVLEDDNKTLKDYGIKEGDFLVVMVSKPKPQASAQPKPEDAKKEDTSAASQSAQQPSASAQPQPAAQANPPAAQAQPTAAAGQALSPELEVAVNDLVAITGKSKEQCTLALRAAQGNPDVAYEILASGMPLNAAMLSGAEPGVGAGAGGDPGADYGDEYGDEGEEEGAGGLPAGSNPFAALASNPNFGMIRQRILQDPNFYQQFMQQLAQTQPQLFQLIQSNPGAFMNLILGGNPNSGVPPMAGAGGAGGHGGANQPGTIRVSPEEMEAITRLTSLGFPKHKAAEAYFACDKNEELAANFLFETGGQDDDEMLQAQINASLTQQQQPPAQQQNPSNPSGGQQQPPSGGNGGNDDKKPDDDSSLL